MPKTQTKKTFVNKFVLHVMSDGRMVDTVYDSKNQRDKAAEAYLRANPGKQVWKTQTQRTA
jgi:hypothetical protein